MSSKIEYWKQLIKKGQDNRAREQGKYEMLMNRLKTEFDHDSVEDLDKEIEELSAQIEEKKATLEKKMEEFANEYAARLEEAAK